MNEKDRKLEAFKELCAYRRGALWWGRDDLIGAVQKDFFRREDRVGHPLLSVLNQPLEHRLDVIPMLMGTSGDKLREKTRRRCVSVRALTRKDPGHVCYFGSIIEPGGYPATALLDAVTPRKDDLQVVRDGKTGEQTLFKSPWAEHHQMRPNADKPRLDDAEMKDLEAFCTRHAL